MKTLLFLLCCVAQTILGSQEFDWDYYRNEHATGPSTWHLVHPDCGGKQQSPVIFNKANARRVKSSERQVDVNFYDFDHIEAVHIRNSHYTFHCSVTAEDGKKPKVKTSLLPEEYCLGGFHFHWGKNDLEGSEHSVGITRSPLEVHFVSYKCSIGDIKAAQKSTDRDAFLVVGVLFRVSEMTENAELQRLLAYLPMLTIPQSVPKLELKMSPVFNMSKLLPQQNRDRLYTYQGSFTTPPCTEIVRWIVFEEKVPISRMQMNLIRHSAVWTGVDESTRMSQNFRPPQRTNGRVIHHYT